MTRHVIIPTVTEMPEQCIQSIIQSLKEATLIINSDSKVIMANDQALQLWDYSLEEILTLNASILIGNDKFQKWLENIKFKKEEEPEPGLNLKDEEIFILTKNGYKTPGLINCSPLFNSKKKVQGGVIIISDRSEEQYLEKAFWENEEKLRYITSYAHDAIIMMDPKGKISFWNKTASKIFGYNDEEVYGVDLHTILAPQRYHAMHMAAFSEFLKSGKGNAINKTIELTALRKSGEEFPIELSLSAMMINKKWNAIGIIRDISERKIAEHKIIESEAYYRTLIDTSPDAIFTTDIEGLITYVSKKALELFNIHEGIKYLGTSILQWTDPDYHNILMERFTGFFDGNYKPEINEYRLIKHDKTPFDCEITISPILNAEENISGILIIAHDITERKKTEKRLLMAKEKAEESDRLKTAFIQNISHEIRTPMNAMVGFSELLKDPTQSEDDKNIFLDNIIDGSNQLLSIITNLVEISNIKSNLIKISPEDIDPGTFLEELIPKFSNETVEKSLQFNIDNRLLSQGGINLKTDKILLSKVMQQIISNAIKFTSEGSISAGCRKVKNNIIFFVSDTGIGIPTEYHDRIFESFFQVENMVSRKYEGTGLGLTISKAYIEKLGGKITLHSEPGVGSEFSFSLPCASIELSLSTDSNKLCLKPSTTILIVEDDDNNFNLIRAYLKDAKINYMRSENGLEAVNICKSKQKIDLILMDIRMPVMNGYEATRIIKEIRPDTPIIAQTAYAENTDQTQSCGFSEFISKPYSKQQLFDTISSALQ
jgi:PAS domain S-box-containing protein